MNKFSNTFYGFRSIAALKYTPKAGQELGRAFYFLETSQNSRDASYLLGVKKDVVRLAKQHGIGIGGLSAATQELCDDSQTPIILIMSESGAAIFRPYRDPIRVLPPGGVLRTRGGPSAALQRLIQGLSSPIPPDRRLVDLVRDALTGYSPSYRADITKGATLAG